MATDTVVVDATPSTSTTAPTPASAITSATIPATTIAAIIELTVTNATPHVEKSQQFNGKDFKRWQQKMVFYLTTLNLAHILKEECLVTPEENITTKTEAAKEA